MQELNSKLRLWTHDPDSKLQSFRNLSDYAKSGRVPWRQLCSYEVEELKADTLNNRPHVENDYVVPQQIFQEALQKRFDRELKVTSVELLQAADPQASAKTLLRDEQKKLGLIALSIFVLFFIFFTKHTFLLLSLLFTIYFVIVVIFRLFLGFGIPVSVPSFGDRIGCNERASLPTITILLPLHDEAASLVPLSQALENLDYPADRIDVKLLLEEDDHDTIARARGLGLDRKWHMIVLPHSLPRTKPKACNHGLQLAKGELIVIYDAEDAPERDQLRKAAEAFQCASKNLACVQARLNFYNARENWLTRMFAIEYALWFDRLLPALEVIRAPIPLGGTSNFFRTETLRELGGWDPFNVTEDADLGMRLAAKGFHTRIIDSTTYEEANSNLRNWLRQRSRWMKGYIQTWVVLMRAPRRFYSVCGVAGLASAHLLLAGTVLSALALPLFWLSLLLLFFEPSPLKLPEIFALTAMAIGNVSAIILAMAAPIRRGWFDLIPYAIFSPVYWHLCSVAAWKGLFQLVTRPHYWEKTDHCLSDAAAAARAAAVARLGATPTDASDATAPHPL